MKLLFSFIAIAGLAFSASVLPGNSPDWVARALGNTNRQTSQQYLTTEVTVGRIQRTITATGSLQAVSTVKVSSQLSGQIAQLQVDFNDAVKAGQSLAVLDQRGYRARVSQAEAELGMAHENVAILSAKLEKAQGIEREAMARRNIHLARIDQAKVRLETAQRLLARTETLARRGAKSKAEVEDAVSARKSAAAQLREAEAAAAAQGHVIATTTAGRREALAELANARAALPLRRAALELAGLDLDRSTIRAPIDGVIIQRNVEKGQTVAASLDAPTLFTIAGDLSEMVIHANVDETDIGEISVGQTAEFTVDAFPGQTFPARITELRKGARVLQGVVSYTVVLQVLNPQGLLLPGMTANARMIVDELENIPSVPLSALRFSPVGYSPNSTTDASTVWLLDQNAEPQPRAVRLGIDNGRDVAILEGDVAAGDRVITGGAAAPAKQKLFGIRF